MRFILWLGVLLSCGAVGYMGSDFLGELQERTEARTTGQMAQRDQVMGVLKTYQRYRFYQVVIGPGEAPGEIGFRGRVSNQGGSSQSAYGIVRATCALPAEEPGCWELASLAIEGVPTDTGTTPPAPAPAASAATDPGTAAAPQPAPEIQPVPAPAVEAQEAATSPGSGEASDPVFRPSHTVRLNRVNARNAPGGAVQTQLTGGTLLMLLETQGGWGHFQVLDGPDTGREVWVAFSVLDTV